MGLTLTRRHGEAITIGEDILVEVVQVGMARCTLRITAPMNLRISREDNPCRQEFLRVMNNSSFTPSPEKSSDTTA